MLHLIASSPARKDLLAALARTISPDDALVLVEQGVLAAGDDDGAKAMRSALPGVRWFVLAEDAERLGIAPSEECRPLDYAGLVELTEKEPVSASWYP